MLAAQTIAHDDNVRKLHFCQRINHSTYRVRNTKYEHYSTYWRDLHLPWCFVNKQACGYWNSANRVRVIQNMYTPKGYRLIWFECEYILRPLLLWRCKLREYPDWNKRSLHWNVKSDGMNVNISPIVWSLHDGACIGIVENSLRR